MTTPGISGALARISAIQSTMRARAAGPPGLTSASATTSFATLLTSELERSASLGDTVSPSSLSPDAFATAARSIGSATASVGSASTAFAAYGNGQVPISALVPIQGGEEYLWAPAATAYEQMVAAAARDGVAISVSDGYRPLAEQEHLAHELGLYSHGGLAAEPGTSQHGWGVAVDLELNDEALSWMRANGAAFGFHETVAREPWHWEFLPSS